MASAMDADRTTPFVDVKRWRARDRHTGIGKDVGVPYTPFEEPTPLHRDVYYVPAPKLNRFFEGWGVHATIVVDVRPLTMAEALEELRAFRIAAESAP
jgi:hypothetical protein